MDATAATNSGTGVHCSRAMNRAARTPQFYRVLHQRQCLLQRSRQVKLRKRSTCGLRPPWGGGNQPIVLDAVRLASFDMFTAGLGFFVSERCADGLAAMRGAVLSRTELRGTAKHAYFLLGSAASLGYPTDGTEWSVPCSACGRRKGVSPPRQIEGFPRYPRISWTNEDFLHPAIVPSSTIVSQSAYRFLANAQWAVPDPGVTARPLTLTDHAPIP